MDNATARRLNHLNARFYQEHAASFSATRQAPWDGWRRCLEKVRATAAAPAPEALAVLDLACGNLRFARFLADALPATALTLDAVDGCPPLVAAADAPAGVRFHEQDVVGALLDDGGRDPLAPLGLAPCDLAVSFGFLHHVPGFENRVALLRSLVGSLRPGGVVAVSLWRFLDDERLARKARASHPAALAALGIEAAFLDEGDRLLGWQDAPDAWRYCHHFTDDEARALADAVAADARLVAAFDADGASGRLNRYLILQARG